MSGEHTPDSNRYNAIVDRIYSYDNYRQFLRDYFREQKMIRACFSHRFFARKAGFASSSFCAHIIEGKRNLTAESVKKMIQGLKLPARSAAFFEILVHYNQSRTVAERERHFHLLEKMRKGASFYKVNQNQYAYYDEWYYPVIRELAVYGKWENDYAALGRMVTPPISADKARKAVDVLLEIGLLVKENDGTLAQASQAITAESIPAVITRKTRKELLLRAIEATDNMSIDTRHIASATVAMDEPTFREITSMLDELRRKIVESAAGCPKVQRVYQFNFQAFPVSDNLGIKESPTGGSGGEAQP